MAFCFGADNGYVKVVRCQRLCHSLDVGDAELISKLLVALMNPSGIVGIIRHGH
jgi:hypothetical protein